MWHDRSTHDSHSLERIQLCLSCSLCSVSSFPLYCTHTPRCRSLGRLAGRPLPGGDGAASCSSSGRSSTDSVLPVFKRSFPLHPQHSKTQIRKTLRLFTPSLPIYLPSCLLCSILWNTLPSSVTSCGIHLARKRFLYCAWGTLGEIDINTKNYWK